jgi:hypothetical protein
MDLTVADIEGHAPQRLDLAETAAELVDLDHRRDGGRRSLGLPERRDRRGATGSRAGVGSVHGVSMPRTSHVLTRLRLSRARRLVALMTPSSLRAAAWALLALRRARRDLAARGLDGALVTSPPRLPASARVGMLAVVHRRPSTCLERALVLQRWEADHGLPNDVVIGVRGAGEDFEAHAWLEGMPDAGPHAFHEIFRLPART